jgi:hypothetical protein
MAIMAFNYQLDFKKVDFRKNPELYRVGKGEQGVLLVEPYKSEILPNWRFKTEEIAQESAAAIWKQFEGYLEQEDFVGADMARKFLQMGYTRARRYANHKSGKKYKNSDDDKTEGKAYPYSSGSINKGNQVLPQEPDALTNEKARAAAVFKKYWDKARENEEYQRQKEKFNAWVKTMDDGQ